MTEDGTELYFWGCASNCAFGGPKHVPTKMEIFEDARIDSVCLGESLIGIVTETQEECKANEFVLKSGDEMTVNDAENLNEREHQIFVQNARLFGDDEWIPIAQTSKYLLFPFCGGEFVENLVVNEEKNAIELVNLSEIDSVYHSDIIGAQFFLYLGVLDGAIIQNVKGFMEKAQKYSFSKIEEISFPLPENQKNVSIYVQPSNAKLIHLVKEINL